MEQETRIEGVVDHIVYANEETGWTVARMSLRGRGQVTAVGALVGAQPGETLRLDGEWIHDRRFGKQFRAERIETVRPATFLGIERYLSSGLVEGIGPTMAKRLVAHFGLDTLDVIDHQPERLVEVEGIGKVRSQRIREAWRTQHHVRDIMVFLQGHGVSATFAAKIQQTYGDEALDVVTKTPHRLARDVRGIGFRTADRIAQAVGVVGDSPERADAGVLHTVREASDRGHVFVERVALEGQAAELLEVDRTIVEPAVDRLVADDTLVAAPMPIGGTAISLRGLAKAEAGLARRLRELTAQADLPLPLDIGKAISWYESRREIELAPAQRDALTRALVAKVLVLTGGPGTGKTTLIRGIIEILGAKKLRIQMAAPTGRAAKRMQESTGVDAKTIHRLLEFQPHTRDFA
ncbi:MAG: helix-hairpin-helix domain-containing protein, partial [Acidobacteriota bacterium]